MDGTLKTFWNNFFHFDAYLSVAETSIKLNFKPVSFSENQFDIENLYHPLISNPVKNSLNTTSNVILLTGANMSGKSTFFKALSICIYLGHLGFRVPAQKCSIPYFDDINIFLNSKDDLESGFSQFMFELNNLKQIVVNAENGQHVYAVIDEMFSGTNIDDASDMFEITIKGLTKYRHCYFFISTHFSHLESFVLSCGKNVSTYFLDAKMENQQPVYTFELKKGWSDQKLGKILFENHGLGKLLTT